MTRTEKAQVVKWLRDNRDFWRFVARNGNSHKAPMHDRVADAFHEAAQQLHYQMSIDPYLGDSYPALH